jgi:hypothetical protein
MQESLFARLVDSMTKSIEAHTKGLERVLSAGILNPNNLSSEWLDPGNWVRDQFDLFIMAPLIAEVKEKLTDVKARAKSMSTSSLDDLDQIWADIEEIREILDGIPVRPNYFRRTVETFGAGKRSAAIRLWNSMSALVTRTVRAVGTELCLSGNEAFCAPAGRGTPMTTDAILEARIEDPPIRREPDLSLEPSRGGQPPEKVVEVGEAVSRSPDSQSAPAEWETIALEADF